LEKHTVFIFRAEVVMLESGGIYTGLEEGKAEEVGQSQMRNEGERSGPMGVFKQATGKVGTG
jgi:hypothetical protein